MTRNSQSECFISTYTTLKFVCDTSYRFRENASRQLFSAKRRWRLFGLAHLLIPIFTTNQLLWQLILTLNFTTSIRLSDCHCWTGHNSFFALSSPFLQNNLYHGVWLPPFSRNTESLMENFTFSDKNVASPTTPTRDDSSFVVQRGRSVLTLSSVARTSSPSVELEKHLKERQNQVIIDDNVF